MLRYILFAFMIVLGILLGNYYATEVNPVDVVDARLPCCARTIKPIMC